VTVKGLSGVVCCPEGDFSGEALVVDSKVQVPGRCDCTARPSGYRES